MSQCVMVPVRHGPCASWSLCVMVLEHGHIVLEHGHIVLEHGPWPHGLDSLLLGLWNSVIRLDSRVTGVLWAHRGRWPGRVYTGWPGRVHMGALPTTPWNREPGLTTGRLAPAAVEPGKVV